MRSARSKFRPGTCSSYYRRPTSCTLVDVPIDRDADNPIAWSPTLATPQPGSAVADTAHPDSAAQLRDSSPSLPGLRISGLIGQGGMGEVVCGHDVEIGRDVAVKRLR